MIIRLAHELDRASDEHHAPATTSADQVRARVARQRARVRNRVLAALAILALAIGLVAWTRPTVRFGPAPTSTPTPNSWWQTNYHESVEPLASLEVPDDEVNRRCSVTAPEVLGPSDFEFRAPGAIVHVFESSEYLPTMTEQADPDGTTWLNWDYDESHARACYLGFETTGDGKQLTSGLLAAESTDWKTLCRDSSGFPFAARWHVASSALDPMDGSRSVALYSDFGALARCQLIPNGTAAGVDFMPPSTDMYYACPDPGLGAVAVDARGSTYMVTRVSFSTVSFVRDERGELTRATQLRATVVGGGITTTFPINSGILLANRVVDLPTPLPQGPDGARIPVKVALLDDAGTVLRTCTVK